MFNLAYCVQSTSSSMPLPPSNADSRLAKTNETECAFRTSIEHLPNALKCTHACVVRRACTQCTHTSTHTVKQSKIKFYHFLFHIRRGPVLFTLYSVYLPSPTIRAISSHMHLPVGRKETNSNAFLLFRVRTVRASFVRFFYSFSREQKCFCFFFLLRAQVVSFRFLRFLNKVCCSQFAGGRVCVWKFWNSVKIEIDKGN